MLLMLGDVVGGRPTPDDLTPKTDSGGLNYPRLDPWCQR